jgi:2-methylcitrate dehydratase PrpD
MRIIETITDHLFETKFANLPANVVEVTKKQVLDTLAATVGGSTCEIDGEIGRLASLVKSWGGAEESTLAAFGGRVPAPNAAFVNGVLCVRLDFDDTQVKGLRLHVSRSIIPTAFAIAEYKGHVNGREFLAAVALGHDLTLRLKRAVGGEADSPFGMITNFFGATATAGKILGLNKKQFEAAFGLTYHQISGAQSGPGTAGAGASIKGLNNGIAAKTGVISALLAEKGFTANSDFLEPQNKRNFYQTFFQGSYSPSLLTQDLGKYYYGLDSAQKEFPCCHGQHTAIEAALSLVNEYNIKPDEIVEVVMHVSPGDYNYLANPPGTKQNPQNIIEAQFSLYWGVASAIVYRSVNIKNFTAKALQDNAIRELAHKISAVGDPALTNNAGFNPAIVDIKTQGSTIRSKRIDSPLGSPENPISFAYLAEKFRHCCEYSVNPIDGKNREKIIKLTGEIESVEDVSQIIRLLA